MVAADELVVVEQWKAGGDDCFDGSANSDALGRHTIAPTVAKGFVCWQNLAKAEEFGCPPFAAGHHNLATRPAFHADSILQPTRVAAWGASVHEKTGCCG